MPNTENARRVAERDSFTTAAESGSEATQMGTSTSGLVIACASKRNESPMLDSQAIIMKGMTMNMIPNPSHITPHPEVASDRAKATREYGK